MFVKVRIGPCLHRHGSDTNRFNLYPAERMPHSSTFVINLRAVEHRFDANHFERLDPKGCPKPDRKSHPFVSNMASLLLLLFFFLFVFVLLLLLFCFGGVFLFIFFRMALCPACGI